MRKALAFGVAGLLAGLWVGAWSKHGTKLVEPRAPSLRQADESLALERTDSVPGKAPHILPSGSNEERRVQVVVQPRRGVVVHKEQPESVYVYHDVHREWPDPLRIAEDSARPWREHGSPSVDSCDCPPVTVELSLVRMPDKTGRVIASSPDGKILTGIDIPLQSAVVQQSPRWTLSAIALADFDGIRPGGLLSHRAGHLVLGGGFLSDPGLRRPGAIVQFGFGW
jgi:hypothetical protein